MNSFCYKNNKYILDCDFLNKHLNKSIYCLPCVDKITISFSISDICDKKIYPAKAFLIFYLIFSFMSLIKMHKLNKNLFNDVSVFDKSCDFHVILSNKDMINLFLFDFIDTKTVLQKKITSLTNISFSSKETKSFSIFFSKKKDSIFKIYDNINFNINFNLKNFSKVNNINLILKSIIT